MLKGEKFNNMRLNSADAYVLYFIKSKMYVQSAFFQYLILKKCRTNVLLKSF